MVDPDRVLRLLRRLQDETDRLRELAKIPDEDLLADPARLGGVKYGFIVAVEICIDVGQHIIASEGLRPPRDFADVFTIIGEGGFVPAGDVPALQVMARFRNLLVHVYEDVDDRRVLEILRTRLGDFDTFRAEIARAALA
jgi:uncharacterized protein YutE (UPF0331/DUF86 family)